MFYQSAYFKIYELVDKIAHTELGEKAWMLFHPYALMTLDKIRQYFDQPIIVNSWHSGGTWSQCGFRSYDSTVGARYSQHKFGNAFDLHFPHITADEVREEILKNKDHEAFKFITCLETDISWVHWDCRNIEDRIQLVKPN